MVHLCNLQSDHLPGLLCSFDLSFINQSYCYLQFHSHRVKSHFLSNKRNLPTINLHLFTCLITFTVCNQSAISVTLPPSFNKFYLSSKDPSCRSPLTLLGFLHYTTWHIFLWAPSSLCSGIDTHCWTTAM